MKRLTLALVLVSTVILAWTQTNLADDKKDDGFTPMFIGESLKGWRHVNTAPSTWSFKDGMLVCSGKPIGELRTDRMYQNFVLELEWRHMVPRGNAGVFVWADDITAKGQPFHRGIEVQVLENAYGNTRGYTTHGDIFPIHGAKMKPVNGRGGSRAFPIENRSKPSPEWNHYRIECRDGNISLAVNGKVVTKGTDCSPRKGYICLESEGGVVHYRNVRIKELPSTPIDARHVAIKDRGYRSLYSGVDLSGWTTKSKDMWTPRDWVLQSKGGGDSAALRTDEQFGDFGFITDVKLGKQSKTLTLALRGSEKAEIAIGVEVPWVTQFGVRTGQWIRLEGELTGDNLSVRVNGKSWLKNKACPGIAAKGPIEFRADAPVEIANIYVRKLKPASR